MIALNQMFRTLQIAVINGVWNIYRSTMSQGGGTPSAGNATILHAGKVFIQRDYSDGTSVKFHTRLPPELEGMVGNQILFLRMIANSLSLAD